jgi:hypothetical protein
MIDSDQYMTHDPTEITRTPLAKALEAVLRDKIREKIKKLSNDVIEELVDETCRRVSLALNKQRSDLTYSDEILIRWTVNDGPEKEAE